MVLKVIAPPTQDPVTLSEIKTYLRIGDMGDFDNLLADLIIAAREAVELFQNRALSTQTLEVSFDDWPEMPFDLPRPPLQSITSVTYTDYTGTDHNMNFTDYFVLDSNSEPARVTLKKYTVLPPVILQDINAFRVRYIAGNANISDIPKTVKQAYLLYISHRFNNPDDINIPDAFYNLLRPERVIPV